MPRLESVETFAAAPMLLTSSSDKSKPAPASARSRAASAAADTRRSLSSHESLPSVMFEWKDSNGTIFFLPAAAAVAPSSSRSNLKAELLASPRRSKGGIGGAEMVTDGMEPEAVDEAVMDVWLLVEVEMDVWHPDVACSLTDASEAVLDEVFSGKSIRERAPVFWQA